MVVPTRLVPEGGRVCIIGGGTSGILAAKTCIDEGLVPTVFEQTNRVGGVWRLDDAPNRVAYKSLYTNSSGCMMCISDFPLSPELQSTFPRRQDICDYYEKYIEHFSLEQYIRFGTEVVAVNREDSRWLVTVRDGRSGLSQSCSFDAVFVCTGQFREPSMPTLVGSEKFKGNISHSSSYRDAKHLAGKHVVLVGIGNSSLDISLEAVRNGSASVTVLCRSGVSVIPVADYHGRPADQMLNTRFYNKLPSILKQLLLLSMVRGTNASFQRHGMPPSPSDQKDMGFSNLKEHVEYRKYLENGSIRLVTGSIQDFKENAMVLSSGEQMLVDEVICCTGYKMDFPYLQDDISKEFLFSTASRQHLNAYKLIMHPCHPTLCGLGYLLSFGNESCVAEMQARWALAHWVGRIALPSATSVDKDLKRRQKGRKYSHFVPYVAYMDELAADCGVSPPMSWTMLLSRPLLFWKLQMAPAVPAHYRLVGDHAWSNAAGFIASQPTTMHRWLQSIWAPPHHPGARAVTPHSRL